MQDRIHDENLRLLLAREEKTYICEQIASHKKTIRLCLFLLAGCFFYVMTVPLLQVLFTSLTVLFLVLQEIALLLAFFCLLMFLPAVFNLIKYRKYRTEQEDFLKKYNRKVS